RGGHPVGRSEHWTAAGRKVDCDQLVTAGRRLHRSQLRPSRFQPIADARRRQQQSRRTLTLHTEITPALSSPVSEPRRLRLEALSRFARLVVCVEFAAAAVVIVYAGMHDVPDLFAGSPAALPVRL